MQRRLTTILATDVVGYSLLMGRDEEGTLANLHACREIIEARVLQHHGRIFGGAGDSAIAEFASPVEAVRCGIDIQQDLAGMNAGLPADSRMQVRIGINLGDVIVDNDNLYGDGVNIAARLEQLAEPGGILMSEDVVRQAEGKIAARFENLGNRSLRNVARPVLVHKVVFADASAPADEVADNRPALPMRPVVAVLPFKNLSNDPEQNYFADGIAEDVITGLSKNPDLFVISQNTTFANRQSPLSASAVHEKYGAQFVLEGSVRKAGKQVRITAKLADMTHESQLWAERFDCDLDDVFAVQDEIVASILHALGAADGVLEKSLRASRRDLSPDGLTAYDCYLQGRDHFYRHGDAGFEKAEALYERAIRLDANFARAYSALAWLHFVRFKLFRTCSFESIRSTAHDLAQAALRIDPRDFRAHWVLGGLNLHDGKHKHSLAEFEKALLINPNDANLLAWSAEVLVYAGQEEDALARCKRAIHLNPNCPDWYHWIMGSAYFHLGRYDDALTTLDRMSATEHAGRLKAATYALLGRLEEARQEAAAFMQIVPGFSISRWARTEHYVKPGELQRYIDGQRKAGLPQ